MFWCWFGPSKRVEGESSRPVWAKCWWNNVEHTSRTEVVPCSWATNGWTPNPQFLGWFAPGWAFHGWCGWATFCDWNSGAPFVREFLLKEECYTVIPNTPANAVCFQRQALAFAPFLQFQEGPPASNHFRNKLALHSKAHVFRAGQQNLGQWNTMFVCPPSTLDSPWSPFQFFTKVLGAPLAQVFTVLPWIQVLFRISFVFHRVLFDGAKQYPKTSFESFNPKRLRKHLAITSDVGALTKTDKCIQEGGCKCLINIGGMFW